MLDMNRMALLNNYSEILSLLDMLEEQNLVNSTMVSPVLTNDFPNILYSHDNMILHLHSQFDPYHESHLTFLNLDEEADFFVVMGCGLFYHIEYLLEKYPHKRVIAIEPDVTIFNYAVMTRDISHLLSNDRLWFVLSDQFFSIILLLARILINEGIKPFDMVCLMSYKQIYGDFYNQLTTEVYNMIKTLRANIGTEYVHSRKWLFNTIKNLKFTNVESYPVSDIFSSMKNIPAVIVSAGPSLSKQLEFLKENENKVVIFAAGSAVNVLERNGITPHFMVAIDSEEIQDNIFRKIESSDITLVYGHTLRHTSLEMFKGKKMWFKGNADPIVEYYEQLNEFSTETIEIGPSCANEATEIARRLGCNPIIFIGQDLAYTGEKLYASDAVHDVDMHTDIGDRILTTDVYGSPIYTKTAFLVMKTYFEAYVRLHPEIEYLNCTEGGLEIKGMKNGTFSEVIGNLEPLDQNMFLSISQLIEETKSRFSKSHYEEKSQAFYDWIKKSIEELHELSNLRIKRVNNLLKDATSLGYVKASKKMESIIEITDTIEKMDLYTYFLHPISAAYIMSVRQNTYLNLDTHEDTMDRFVYLLNGIQKQYQFVHVMINAVKDALNDMTFEKGE